MNRIGKLIITALITGTILFSGFCRETAIAAPDKVSLVLQWLTQCQFAGYYVGLEKGFYLEENIDLTIKPGAPDVNPILLVSTGMDHFGTKWMADFLAAADNKHPLVSIAQVVQKNGLVLVAKAASGIKNPRDFIGKRLGIWYFGNEVQFYALMNSLNIPLDKINIKPLKWSITPFLKNEFDVVTAMIYNEYIRILDSGYKKEDLNIIDFSDYGLNFPGQVLFTNQTLIKKQPDLCRRMVRASLRGWAYAVKHPEEAVEIVLKNDKTGKLEKNQQLKQMRAMIQLIRYGSRPLGFHEPGQVSFVMKRLVENKVISAPLNLDEVYTNRIWELAVKDRNW